MLQNEQVLSVLVSLNATAENFAKELQQNLAGVDAAELQQIAAAVYMPFESQISRLASLHTLPLNRLFGSMPF